MDLLLGEFAALAADDTQLIFATALSQQPYLKYEGIGGHHFYRPRNVHGMFAELGISADSVQPVMTHQYIAHFADDRALRTAIEAIGGLMLDGKPVFEVRQSGPLDFYFGNQVHTRVADGSRVICANQRTPDFGYYDIFYRIEDMKSGRHHPHGCLWIETGRHMRHRDHVSILDILPTVLRQLGLSTDGFAGRSLLEPRADTDTERAAVA